MIPRGLLPGKPISFYALRAGDVIDTYDPVKEERSRYHKRMNQTVLDNQDFGCDIYTDYDMICKNFGLWIQLRHRPMKEETK